MCLFNVDLSSHGGIQRFRATKPAHLTMFCWLRKLYEAWQQLHLQTFRMTVYSVCSLHPRPVPVVMRIFGSSNRKRGFIKDKGVKKQAKERELWEGRKEGELREGQRNRHTRRVGRSARHCAKAKRTR